MQDVDFCRCGTSVTLWRQSISCCNGLSIFACSGIYISSESNLSFFQAVGRFYQDSFLSWHFSSYISCIFLPTDLESTSLYFHPLTENKSAWRILSKFDKNSFYLKAFKNLIICRDENWEQKKLTKNEYRKGTSGTSDAFCLHHFGYLSFLRK